MRIRADSIRQMSCCLEHKLISGIAYATQADATSQLTIWLPSLHFAGLFCGDALDGALLWFGSMVIRVRCRRLWVSALMRSLRNEVFPTFLRRFLIVVDQPKVVELPSAVELSRPVDLQRAA